MWSWFKLKKKKLHRYCANSALLIILSYFTSEIYQNLTQLNPTQHNPTHSNSTQSTTRKSPTGNFSNKESYKTQLFMYPINNLEDVEEVPHQSNKQIHNKQNRANHTLPRYSRYPFLVHSFHSVISIPPFSSSIYLHLFIFPSLVLPYFHPFSL